MAKKFIIGNWKSYKDLSQVIEWMDHLAGNTPFNSILDIREGEDEKVAIVCPPFVFLSEMKKRIDEEKIHIGLGAQNCSPFEEGAYTGEVTAKQVRELGEYVIIGHSERRKYFNETDELLTTKVQLAKAAGLTVIFCVQGKDTSIPEEVDIVAYEPIFAIGSGTPDTPENAEEVSRYLKQEKGAKVVLYGGSVKPENIASFTAQPSIDGALVGGASLEADSFISLVENA